ncbi:MAG: fumarate hydratase C-terminal domain-containing protein [Methanobacteriaceae archaeon]|jgi:fumarate hydratase subunit beta|nr:fumarate hydratase C-terminal domain-containing protein [Methanobacteriaceae archaeon]
MIHIKIPLNDNEISKLKLGDKIAISGEIYTGRDKALPKLVKAIKNDEKIFDIEGAAIMHTGVSDAGIGPTTSNKKEIESTMGFLSKSGVKMHIGKGSLSSETIKELNKYNSIFVITPPVTALLTDCIKNKKCIAFKEEGIEAIYKLKVENIPGIVASINGEVI